MRRNRARRWISILGISFFSCSLCSCAGKVLSSQTSPALENGGFEDGDLTGWEVFSGTAFDQAVDVASGDNRRLLIEGDYFLNSGMVSSSAKGELHSCPFVLTGNGKIGFKIGGGSDISLCYVALCSSEGKELFCRSNDDFDKDNPSFTMHREIINAVKYVGQTVFIKIVDADGGEGAYGSLMVDDFRLDYQGEEEMASLVKDATSYIEENKDGVGGDYRPTYHYSAPIGWMNDPNGFSLFGDKIHLFYQYNPFSTAWDTMYWGHVTSEDYVVWRDEMVALAPDHSYDRAGCFSGGAIEEGGKHYLLYTGVGETGQQQQCLASSSDGVNYEKSLQNPIIPTSKIPSSGTVNDFRDPAIWKKDGAFYALIGSKMATGGGQLLLYKAAKIQGPYSFVGVPFSSKATGGGILECPDYEEIGDSSVLLASPQYLHDKDAATYQNVHSVTYQIGTLDYVNGTFQNAEGEGVMEELDKGFDFYAASCSKAQDGRIILIAWMNMWGRSSFPSAGEGWTGSMVLPRELTLRDNHLYQSPVKEIEAYRGTSTTLDPFSLESQSKEAPSISGKTMEIQTTLDVSKLGSGRAGLHLFEGRDHWVDVSYNGSTGLLSFSRKQQKIVITGQEDGLTGIRYARVSPVDGKIKLRLFLDRSSLEVFINDGYYTMSGTLFPDKEETGVSFYASDGLARFENVVAYPLEVKQ